MNISPWLISFTFLIGKFRCVVKFFIPQMISNNSYSIMETINTNNYAYKLNLEYVMDSKHCFFSLNLFHI